MQYKLASGWETIDLKAVCNTPVSDLTKSLVTNWVQQLNEYGQLELCGALARHAFLNNP